MKEKEKKNEFADRLYTCMRMRGAVEKSFRKSCLESICLQAVDKKKQLTTQGERAEGERENKSCILFD